MIESHPAKEPMTLLQGKGDTCARYTQYDYKLTHLIAINYCD